MEVVERFPILEVYWVCSVRAPLYFKSNRPGLMRNSPETLCDITQKSLGVYTSHSLFLLFNQAKITLQSRDVLGQSHADYK